MNTAVKATFGMKNKCCINVKVHLKLSASMSVSISTSDHIRLFPLTLVISSILYVQPVVSLKFHEIMVLFMTDRDLVECLETQRYVHCILQIKIKIVERL